MNKMADFQNFEIKVFFRGRVGHELLDLAKLLAMGFAAVSRR